MTLHYSAGTFRELVEVVKDCNAFHACRIPRNSSPIQENQRVPHTVLFGQLSSMLPKIAKTVSFETAI
jgi:hypothetical protein